MAGSFFAVLFQSARGVKGRRWDSAMDQEAAFTNQRSTLLNRFEKQSLG